MRSCADQNQATFPETVIVPFSVRRHVCILITFQVALVQGKKVLILHICTLLSTTARGWQLQITAQLHNYRWKGNANALSEESNRHLAPLIVSSSWLTLIKNSITLTMLINYIQRFTNRRADKGFFEITKQLLGSTDRMQNCSRPDKCFFSPYYLFYFLQEKETNLACLSKTNRWSFQFGVRESTAGKRAEFQWRRPLLSASQQKVNKRIRRAQGDRMRPQPPGDGAQWKVPQRFPEQKEKKNVYLFLWKYRRH